MADMDLQIKISSDVNAAVNNLGKVTDEVRTLAETAKNSGIFSTLEKQASGFAQTFSSHLGPIGSMIGKFLTSPLGAAAAAVGALAIEAQFLIEKSLSGEKLKAIDTQFQNLAKSVNISADNLKNRLLKSMDGLVDGAASIQIANRALITLGEKAVVLPKLLDIARKSAVAFGGDPLQNLELLIRAVETGNTRVLKNMRLTIDAKKAMDEYAASHGRAAEELTEEGKQQAIINAILGKAETAYKNVDASLTPLADSGTRLRNSISDLKEEFDKFIATNYAQFFTEVFEAAANGLKKLTGNFQATDRVKELAKEIDDLQLTINQLNLDKMSLEGEKGINALASLSFINTQLNNAKGALIPLTAEYKNLTKTVAATNKELEANANAFGDDPSTSFVAKVAVYNDTYKRLELLRKQHSLNIEKIETDQEAKIDAINDPTATVKRLEAKFAAEQEYYLKKQELERQDLELTLAKNLATAQTETEGPARVKAVETANNNARIETLKLRTQQEKEILQQASDQEVEIINAKYAKMKPYADSFASGLTNSFIEIATGAEDLGRSLEKFAGNFIKELSQMIVKAILFDTIMKSLGFGAGQFSSGAPGGSSNFNQGASPNAFAAGGYVSGPGTGTSDSIAARLSNGEFVMRAAAVKSLGVDFLHGLNGINRNGARSKSKGGVRAYADGGMVERGGVAPQVVIQNSGTAKQEQSTTFDPTTQVTTIILEDIQRNGNISKSIQGTFGVKRGGFR